MGEPARSTIKLAAVFSRVLGRDNGGLWGPLCSNCLHWLTAGISKTPGRDCAALLSYLLTEVFGSARLAGLNGAWIEGLLLRTPSFSLEEILGGLKERTLCCDQKVAAKPKGACPP